MTRKLKEGVEGGSRKLEGGREGYTILYHIMIMIIYYRILYYITKNYGSHWCTVLIL